MSANRTIEIRGQEHATALDALNAACDHAISIGGRFFAIDDAEYRRLQDAGIQPTTWHYHAKTGRTLCVPGNAD